MASEPTLIYSASADVCPGAAAPGPVRLAHSLRPLPFRRPWFAPWVLAAGDLVAVEVAYSLARVARHALDPWWPWTHHLANGDGVRAGLALFIAGCYLAGLYPGYGISPVERLRRRVITLVLAFAGVLSWDELVYHNGWSRSALVLTCAFTVALSHVLQEAMIAALIRMGRWGAPAVILSAGQAGTALAVTLRRRRELGLVPVALFKNAPETWGRTLDGVPVLGPPAMAADFAAETAIAVVAMPGVDNAHLSGVVERLPFRSVIVVPEFAGFQSLWVIPRDLGGTLGLELTRNLLLKRNFYFKRLIDYALGVPLFLLSAPLIALLALWVKCVSPGPAFYSQEREGIRGRRIRIWKLRTMYLDAERTLERHLAENPDERDHWLRFFKLKSDPRILPRIGTLLRKTSLDELPQLWNVLRGDLSLVGPRPFPSYHMNSFGDDFRVLRQSVLPGITGFWQVSARSDGDLKTQEHLDKYYIRNWSLWLDLYILARTAAVVLCCKGAY